ncbi:ADP-ribosylglycohydrolase family protein [Candidatus Uabimicrobium amorphum]|uniref:Hydrolase n=1 Tax=Uabimicrobium amorphum TaxID=2596890 RepID=A0A5S9F689_UABAM|nr:ADP-ribosylglycohydrolase family protein [Candidatus Uabimicrobium amorphum]BBM87428.1 hydrolase [Candidatus Uabimicrobium amorphum]
MQKLPRAQLALEGLSVGDAFGQKFFGNYDEVVRKIEERVIPQAPWHLTDDSIMGIAIVETLQKHDGIDQDYFAQCLAKNYKKNIYRGYGGMAHSILQAIYQGQDWRIVSPSVFDGSGSYGNGAAMRIAPLGGYFADHIPLLKKHALLSGEVTHAHLEGKVGGLAVALAASWAFNHQGNATISHDMLHFVVEHLPDSDVKSGIAKACELPLSYKVETATAALGNGSQISAQDTVPFTLWCAARHINDFEEAMWATVSGLGDRDTTCAIVGGIVALSVGEQGIPKEWLQARESLTNWEGRESQW